jgi:hypothetical protein
MWIQIKREERYVVVVIIGQSDKQKALPKTSSIWARYLHSSLMKGFCHAFYLPDFENRNVTFYHLGTSLCHRIPVEELIRE